eukprot:868625_1
MTLKDTIVFRQEVARLTDDEFDAFREQLNELMNRKNVVESVFFYFNNKTENQSNKYKLSTIQEAITGIIQNRSDRDESTTLTTNVIENDTAIENDVDTTIEKLDCLPSQIIGEACSYLNVYDYIALQQTNRSVYIKSNAPCSALQDLSMNTCISREHKFHFDIGRRYPLLRRISVNMPALTASMQVMKFQNKPYTPCTRLTSLTLHCMKEIKLFIQNNNLIPLNQITNLSLNKYSFIQDEFCTFLKHFTSLKALRLHRVRGNNGDFADILLGELFESLTSFESVNSNQAITRQIIYLYANQLQRSHVQHT